VLRLVNPVKGRLASEADSENSSSSFRDEPRLQLREEAIRCCASRVYDVVLLACIQLGDIAHPYTAFAPFDQFNLVTHSDLTLLQHGKIEARALAPHESLDDVGAAEPDAELVTGHPWFGHHHDG
jgi:hypothetical protein